MNAWTEIKHGASIMLIALGSLIAATLVFAFFLTLVSK